MKLTYDILFRDAKKFKMPEELLIYAWLAVNRGGLALGQMLSTMYDKPLGVIDPHTQEFILPKDFGLFHTPVLLIDDVAKTGSTIKICKDLLQGIDVKTLFYIYDPSNKAEVPDYYILKTSVWLELPWEPGDEGRS